MAQRRPWSLESGAGEEGVFSADAQLKGCASVMMTPMVVPCPPNHLVSELTTSSGPVFDAAQQVNGVVKVASTMGGMPLAWAMSEMARDVQHVQDGIAVWS